MPSTAFSPTTCWVFFFFSTPEVFIPSIGNGHCKSHHSTAHNFHNAISMRFIECFLSAKRHTHVAPSSESLALSSFPPTNTHNILVPPCVCVCVCECVLYRVVAILLHTFVHAHRQIEFMRCRQWVKLSQRVGQGAALISSCHGDDEDEGGDE